jgi:acyl carrier protein
MTPEMTSERLLQAFTDILRGLLGDDTLSLACDTRRHEVPGWDSFSYVNFIVAVEMQYGVKFRVADVESFQTVGEIAERTMALMQTRRK